MQSRVALEGWMPLGAAEPNMLGTVTCVNVVRGSPIAHRKQQRAKVVRALPALPVKLFVEVFAGRGMLSTTALKGCQ